MTTKRPRPTDVRLHQKSRILEVVFDNDSRFRFPCEYLRVYSPSAEVQGHGPGQEVLQIGKENVCIINLEPVGTYAVRLYFDDGHNTGLYSWEWLYHLGVNQERLWQQYLERLAKAGHKRDVKPAH
ncbi:MAG: gamma-butyrobetaine hydroxylase-like domain-containing protein [Acidiferrobacterales bacterium]